LPYTDFAKYYWKLELLGIYSRRTFLLPRYVSVRFIVVHYAVRRLLLAYVQFDLRNIKRETNNIIIIRLRTHIFHTISTSAAILCTYQAYTRAHARTHAHTHARTHARTNIIHLMLLFNKNRYLVIVL